MGGCLGGGGGGGGGGGQTSPHGDHSLCDMAN